MKCSIYLNLLIATVLLVPAIGCQRKPKAPTPIPGATARPPAKTDTTFGSDQVPPANFSDNAGPGVRTTPVPPITEGTPLPPTGPEGMQQDKEFFKANTVHFDFDRSSIRAGDRPKIEAVATHLKQNATHRVRVGGYTDERGTVEYNLSLGERRALAVREFMINLGISGDRIYTISFGESYPADPASNEAAWARNRRAEFVLLTP